MRFFICVLTICVPGFLFAQHDHHDAEKQDHEQTVQPLLTNAARLAEALRFIGSSLQRNDEESLAKLQHLAPDKEIAERIQEILDPYCLAIVHINPEARVKVDPGPAIPRLIQGGWTTFLVKIHNDAGVTAPLVVESPQAMPPLHPSAYQPVVDPKRKLSPGQVANRFLEVAMYTERPLRKHLSGVPIEYAVVQIYSKHSGSLDVEVGFNVGHGTQDIGFRNTIPVLFNSLPSVKVKFRIRDHDDTPAMASFIITDGVERLVSDSTLTAQHFRITAAQRRYDDNTLKNTANQVPASLRGIYPLPGRRVATHDEYPDFFFQPQVYRSDGEHVFLPPGRYNVVYTRGPEYEKQEYVLTVPKNIDSMTQTFRLKRWINMAGQGWYSSDHHVHAAGCSHYESPEEGVRPQDMWRQSVGEDLNVSAVLGWGPGWYHQKSFFNGEVHELSTSSNMMRYDVEVSGFPSSHAGHLVLLRMSEDDYPGTSRIEEWPSWTKPVLEWAKSQHAITGYAHSGWGLEPQELTTDLPNYAKPRMDGIGANEYIVTVTKGLVDFYSAGNTPWHWELNMWYHTLNAGLRPRLSGETDFPCIFDERVGMARSYFKADSLNYESFANAIRSGRNYVSEGNAHLIDFFVNDTEMGVGESELRVNTNDRLRVTVRVAARLDEKQSEEGGTIASRPLHLQPYWHIERARIGTSRNIAVELVVNGKAVEQKTITADGSWQNLKFEHRIRESAWIALRVPGAAHTNPVFAIVNDKPIVSKESVKWCRDAVDECWKKKRDNIRPEERQAAEKAYNEAKVYYDSLVGK